MARASRGTMAVDGLNALVRDLQKLGVEVDDLKDVFQPIAQMAAKSAASFAPVQTGNLRDTIRGNRAKNKAVVTAGRARVPYAGPINYGWAARNIQPALFLQKADEVMGPKAVEMLEEGIDKLIDRLGLDQKNYG